MKNKQTIKIKPVIEDSIDLIFKSAFYVILFEIIYKGLISLLFKPALNLIVGFFISIGGYDVLINADISQFFMSIFGVLMVLILLILSVVLVYYEFTVILLILDSIKEKRDIDLLGITETALLKLKNIIKHNRIGLGFYILILIPILNFGIKSSLLPSISIPDFITGEVVKYPGGQYLILLLMVFLIYLFAKLFIVLPIMVFSNKSYKEGWRLSFSTIKGSGFKIAILIILALLIWMAIGYIPFMIFKNSSFIIFKIFKVFSNMFMYLSTILVSPFILTVSYITYRSYVDLGIIEMVYDEENIELGRLGNKIWKFLEKVFEFIQNILSKLNQQSRSLGLLILIVIIGFSIYDVEMAKPLYGEQVVIGHRGSIEGVENTIDTIVNAGKMGADYVEMDVLLSKDNVPVVIHDNSLKRLAKKSTSISKLNLDEILEIEITNGKEKANIPSLRQLAQATKGEAKLLLEFKTHGKEKGSIVDETIKILEEEGILEDTIFHTAEFSILEEFEEKYGDRDLKIGYVFIGTIGNLSARKISKIPMDFITAEESLINKKIIREAHKSEKPILAWTINDDYKAERLFQIGVDGIITDHPREMMIIRDEFKDKIE